MKLKHTPGPWAERDWVATGPTAAANLAAIAAITDELPEVCAHPVVQACAVGKAVVCTVYGMSSEEVLANAAFIVRACNAHELLIEALKDCARHPRKAQRENIVAKALAAIERTAQ